MVVCNLNCVACPFAYLCIPLTIGAFLAIKRYQSRLQKKRLVSQVSFLFITNTAFIFGATGLIYTYFYCWEGPLALMACPIGLLQDLTRGIRTKHPLDEKMRYLKYAILALIPPVCYVTGTLAYTNICPVGGLTATLPHLALDPNGYTFTAFFVPKMLILAGFFVLILLMTRGWCRHLCPVGAMMAPFNRISVLELRYFEDKCIKCFKCAKVCPMQIDMPYDNRSGECIRCGTCVDACPTDALALAFRWK